MEHASNIDSACYGCSDFVIFILFLLACIFKDILCNKYILLLY